MNLHELIYIARSDLTEAQVEDLNKMIENIVTSKAGNKVEKFEPWGIRTLAYRSKKLKKNKAFYCMVKLSLQDVTVLEELKNKLLLNEAVLRFMVKRVESFEDFNMSSYKKPNSDRKYNEAKEAPAV